MRDQRLRRTVRAMRLAWRRSFGSGVRIDGAAPLRRRYQAVFITPAAGNLRIAAVDARDWQAILDLGWSVLTGRWVEARSVDVASSSRVRVRGRKPVLALFDGEPQMLEPGATITGGRTGATVLTTKPFGSPCAISE